jgi:hypothetical protein
MARSIIDEFLLEADEFATHPIHDIDGSDAEAFAVSMEVFELMHDEGLTLDAACEKFSQQSSLSVEEIKKLTLESVPDIDLDRPVDRVSVAAFVHNQRDIIANS